MKLLAVLNSGRLKAPTDSFRDQKETLGFKLVAELGDRNAASIDNFLAFLATRSISEIINFYESSTLFIADGIGMCWDTAGSGHCFENFYFGRDSFVDSEEVVAAFVVAAGVAEPDDIDYIQADWTVCCNKLDCSGSNLDFGLDVEKMKELDTVDSAGLIAEYVDRGTFADFAFGLDD